MSGIWRRRIATILVVLSFTLQLAAIFSPGWLIDIKANVEIHDSVFYKMECITLVETNCEAETLRDIYAEARQTKERAGMANVAITELDYVYHQLILKQVLVVVSLAATLLLVVAQILRHCHEDRRYHRLITRTAVFGTIPTGLMISVICQDCVYTAYMIELRSFDDDRDHTYIGFPYSIAMYIGALTFLFLAIFVLTNQSAGPGKVKAVGKRPIDDEYSVDERPPVKAEFVPIHENVHENSTTPVVEIPKPAVEKPKPTIETNNTVIYSEKL